MTVLPCQVSDVGVETNSITTFVLIARVNKINDNPAKRADDSNGGRRSKSYWVAVVHA